MKKAFLLCQEELPAYDPEDVLALVDLLWLAYGCPPGVPS